MPTRRQVIIGAAASAVSALAPSAPAIARAKPKVVIVGGGAGGASVLNLVSAVARGALDITLIEPQRALTTCYYSNLHLGGVREMETLRFGFDAIAARPGVSVVHEAAAAIDSGKREVRLTNGAVVAYDRLVLSPGIALDYASVPGWSREAEDAMPHAWTAGAQTALLKRRIDAVPDGGLIVMIAPPNPYRCPPGPYERASMMAQALTKASKTRARIVILDAKDKFSKQPLFQQGWEQHYPGMIEWQPPAVHGGVKGVIAATMSVETDFETYRDAALVNVIPKQTAGRIAIEAGLTGANGFCPIDPFTMKARGHNAIFILGDACDGGDMPKSAFSANSQAQVVAEAIAHELLGGAAPQIAYRNKCWSLIAPGDSVFVGGEYEPTEAKIREKAGEISGLRDTPETRRTNAEDSEGWYAGLTSTLYL
ncbi:MAG: NAD(P)/FAD-dependent oxidoreductase [Hyphomicrobiales bacterium]|nr:NAD(P)/FAD-dependent oxidoreductase [Hyphomicrobiales bacterium]